MNPLPVAVIVKQSSAAFERNVRMMGMWSYPVPEFTWDFIAPGKQFIMDTRSLAGKYAVIFHEDGGCWGTYRNHALPIIYYVIDSTLSRENHYLPRYEQARQSDLVLVDHDLLGRFEGTKKPVKRLSYCVNDHVFKDYGHEKDTDIVFHCSRADNGRGEIRNALHGLAVRYGYTYRSGTLPLIEYAQSMNRAKIVVNVPRTWQNRPHRVFDAMACRAALLTAPIPEVSDEFREPGIHYETFVAENTLEAALDFMLSDGSWQPVAEAGYELVQKSYTWAVRAKELRELIHCQFGV